MICGCARTDRVLSIALAVSDKGRQYVPMHVDAGTTVERVISAMYGLANGDDSVNDIVTKADGLIADGTVQELVDLVDTSYEDNYIIRLKNLIHDDKLRDRDLGMVVSSVCLMGRMLKDAEKSKFRSGFIGVPDSDLEGEFCFEVTACKKVYRLFDVDGEPVQAFTIILRDDDLRQVVFFSPVPVPEGLIVVTSAHVVKHSVFDGVEQTKLSDVEYVSFGE